jgi:hypothetical protein
MRKPAGGTSLRRTEASPLDLTALLQAHLESLDPTTRSWANSLAPLFASLIQTLHVPVEKAIDYLYAAEKPIDGFTFSIWIREQAANDSRERRAVA